MESVNGKRRTRAISLLTLVWSCSAIVSAWSSSPADAAGGVREAFASPEAAVAALITAIRGDQTEAIAKILGPDSRNLVYSGDAVADDRRHLTDRHGAIRPRRRGDAKERLKAAAKLGNPARVAAHQDAERHDPRRLAPELAFR